MDMRNRATPLLLHRLGSILTWVWYPVAFLPLPLLAPEVQRILFPPGRDCATCVLACILLTVIHLVRWAVGDHAYITRTYSMDAMWIGSLRGREKEQIGRAIASRFVLDLFLLLIHGAILCWMALAVSSVSRFNIALIALLLSDTWWLLYDRYVWPRWLLLLFEIRKRLAAESCRGDVIRLHVPPDTRYPPRTWTWTNLATALILIVIVVAERQIGATDGIGSTLTVVMAGMLNSYVDFRKTFLWLI